MRRNNDIHKEVKYHAAAGYNRFCVSNSIEQRRSERQTIMIQATDPNYRDAVVAYYDQTWLDYRLFWLNRRTLSVHFGYTDATTRGHADALLNMNRVLADRADIQQ